MPEGVLEVDAPTKPAKKMYSPGTRVDAFVKTTEGRGYWTPGIVRAVSPTSEGQILYEVELDQKGPRGDTLTWRYYIGLVLICGFH